MDGTMGRKPDRVRRRVGSLASAAHLLGADACGARRHAGRRHRTSGLVCRRPTAHGDASGARRNRPARMGQLRRWGAGGAAAAPRSPARDRQAAALRPADDRTAPRSARPRRRGASGPDRRARVAGQRAAGRCGRRLGAALARALGIQPRPDPVHGGPGADRQGNGGALARDRLGRAVRAAPRHEGGCRSAARRRGGGADERGRRLPWSRGGGGGAGQRVAGDQLHAPAVRGQAGRDRSGSSVEGDKAASSAPAASRFSTTRSGPGTHSATSRARSYSRTARSC